MPMTHREILAFAEAHMMKSGGNKIPTSLLNNIAERLRVDLYQTVMAAWMESDMLVSELSARSGISEVRLMILLSGPSEWRIETVARLLFAINGHLVQPTTIGAAHLSPPNKGV